VFGALAWQFRLVARAVARRQRDGERNAPAAGGGRAAERTDRMAARLDEAGLRRALRLLLDGDTRAKSGGDAAWALERSVLVLAGAFERGR
jgi:DNA polymerase III delta subunit